jgi:hypothetical protein
MSVVSFTKIITMYLWAYVNIYGIVDTHVNLVGSHETPT